MPHSLLSKDYDAFLGPGGTFGYSGDLSVLIIGRCINSISISRGSLGLHSLSSNLKFDRLVSSLMWLCCASWHHWHTHARPPQTITYNPAIHLSYSCQVNRQSEESCRQFSPNQCSRKEAYLKMELSYALLFPKTMMPFQGQQNLRCQKGPLLFQSLSLVKSSF